MPTGRHKKMKGGLFGWGESTNSTVPSSNIYSSTVPRTYDSSSNILDSLGSTLSGWGTSIKDSASSAFNKTQNAYNSGTGSPSYTAPRQPYTQPYIQRVGGKNKGKKRSRKMRGGYGDNIALTGLAASASSISDIKSSQPLNIVGGKRRTKKCRRSRNSKSCKRRRH